MASPSDQRSRDEDGKLFHQIPMRASRFQKPSKAFSEDVLIEILHIEEQMPTQELVIYTERVATPKQAIRRNASNNGKKLFISLLVSCVLIVLISLILHVFTNTQPQTIVYETPWGSVQTQNGTPSPDYNTSTLNTVSNHIAWVDDATGFEYLNNTQFNQYTWSACFPMSMTVILNAWGAWQPGSKGPVQIIDPKNQLIIGQIIQPLADQNLISGDAGWLAPGDPTTYHTAGDQFGYKVDVHYDSNFNALVHVVNDLGIPVIASAYRHWYVVYHVNKKTGQVFMVDPNIYNDHTWTVNRHAKGMTVYDYTHGYWTGIWLVYTPKFKWTPDMMKSNPQPIAIGSGFFM